MEPDVTAPKLENSAALECNFCPLRNGLWVCEMLVYKVGAGNKLR